MFEKIKNRIKRYNLAAKIRYSYLILLIPSIIFIAFLIFSVSRASKKYDGIVEASVVASKFSLDFKEDYDYETYLLIVGNISKEESTLNKLLNEAEEIVDELDMLTTNKENKSRLVNIQKYLDNLRKYNQSILDNIGQENKYEDNIQIWENDIQILTSLLQENVTEYIYYEIKEMQHARESYDRFYQRMLVTTLIAFIFMLLLTFSMSYFIPQSITRPIREIGKVTDQIAKGNLSVRSEVSGAGEELEALSDQLNVMIDKINELLAQVKEEQISLRKAELELLQAQINPHFLYNTLDTIIWLAEGGDMKKVVTLVGSLSTFFRASLNKGLEIVTVKEELAHIRSYLEIQQVRYQDILEYKIDIQEDLYSYQIPKITLQPLVENALYHGIKNKRGMGHIIITGEKCDDGIYLHVDDNGIGIPKERLEQIEKSLNEKTYGDNAIYGVFNVNERIKLKFGENYGIFFESEEGVGTKVTVKLPVS